jgi:hypothetical protein
MQDLETESLWSQVTGECISGSMEGKSLTLVSAVHTTYAEFKKNYPGGVMLKKEEKGTAGSSYDRYFADPDRLGIFGRENNFDDLDGKDLIFGLRLNNREVAVSLDYLSENEYLIIPDDTDPVIVTYSATGKTGAALSLRGFDANIVTELKIENGKIIIRGTDTAWDADTGAIVSGEGENLSLYAVITSYWFAWISFFPGTELVK